PPATANSTSLAAKTTATNTTARHANATTWLRGSGSASEQWEGLRGKVNKTATVANLGDDCATYALDGSLRRPKRSCFDCLNVPLLDGSVCMLNRQGDCAKLDNSAGDHGGSQRAGYDYFLSSTSKYCSDDDPACLPCRQTGSSEGIASRSCQPLSVNDRVCKGSNGCVCLSMCELKVNATEIACTRPPATTSSNESLATPVWLIYVGVLILGMVTLIVRRLRTSNNNGDNSLGMMGGMAHGRAMARATGTSHRAIETPQLTLEGWQAMRNSLIEHEHEALGLPPTPTRSDTNAEAPSIMVEYGPTTHPLEHADSNGRI
ncbi:TPA: hypothetical protein N0F65_008923, partial [Lagenidium giganteum]